MLIVKARGKILLEFHQNFPIARYAWEKAKLPLPTSLTRHAQLVKEQGFLNIIDCSVQSVKEKVWFQKTGEKDQKEWALIPDYRKSEITKSKPQTQRSNFN